MNQQPQLKKTPIIKRFFQDWRTLRKERQRLRRAKKIRKKYSKVISTLRHLDELMTQQGWSRQERREMWRKFVKQTSHSAFISHVTGVSDQKQL